MLLSVIVPVYNVEQYLSKCIDSILNQEFKDFELILIDDGSSDNSGKICDEYVIHNDKVKVYHQINGGVSSARNKGLNEAQGDYICFIDADDYILPNYFTFINQNVKNCDIIKFGTPNLHHFLFYYEFMDFLSSEYFSPTIWSYVIKRELIEKYNIRFPINVTHSEDRSFLFKALLWVKKILVVNDNFYSYQYRPDSVIHQKLTHKASGSHLNALADILIFYKQCNITDAFPYKRVMKDLYFYFILLLKIPFKEFSFMHAHKSFVDFKNQIVDIHRIIEHNFYIKHSSNLFLCIFRALIYRVIHI